VIGVGVGIAWESRPPNWPNIGFLWFHLGTGDGLAAQRDKARAATVAAQAAFATEQRSFHIVLDALNGQSRSVAALSAEGSRLRADDEAAVSAYEMASKRASGAETKIEAALAAAKGAPDCQRYDAVHSSFTGTLQ
jgi:hypothetical protein